MFFRELLPDPRLNDVVRAYWQFEGPGGRDIHEHLRFPQHLWHLDFCSADSWQQAESGLWEVAPAGMLRPLSAQTGRVTSAGFSRRLAAELYPWAVQSLFDWALENPERLALAPESLAIRASLSVNDWTSAQEILQDWLLRLQARSGLDPGRGIQAARILYDTPGLADIGALAGAVNLSSRQLEREFKRELGVTPKTLARLVRFNAVVDTLQQGAGVSLTALAYDLGFADQSHLTKEFRAMSLMTPSAYLRQVQERKAGELPSHPEGAS